MITVFHDFLSPERCALYRDKVSQHFHSRVEQGFHPWDFLDSRNIEISDDPIGLEVKAFLESKIKVQLTCDQIELQTWPINCPVGLHVHNDRGREKGDYNSLLYLNSDFKGGEFYTNTGFTLTPTVGTLTFFDGSNIHHGVAPITENHRYTIIFWWKNTQWL